MDSPNDLFAAHDVLNEREPPTDGIGQHSISRGQFLYARDPVSTHRIEYNTGSYLTDPHWEPVTWTESDLDDRQWICEIQSRERNPYKHAGRGSP